VNRAERLARDAATAAEVRAFQTHPDVVALRIERVRRQVDWMCWSGIVLGLAFTMTNVQGFAAAGVPPWSLPWIAAWVLDPTVSLVLLAILRAEQVTARYQIQTGVWVRRAKWFTLAATYVMNTWASFAAGSVASIVLHSVPPLVVFVAAEAISDLRERLTDAALQAVNGAAVHVNAPAVRKVFADYLADARAAWSADVEITPAWIRQVTDCSRGLSPKLAKALRAEVGHE